MKADSRDGRSREQGCGRRRGRERTCKIILCEHAKIHSALWAGWTKVAAAHRITPIEEQRRRKILRGLEDGRS